MAHPDAYTCPIMLDCLLPSDPSGDIWPLEDFIRQRLLKSPQESNPQWRAWFIFLGKVVDFFWGGFSLDVHPGVRSRQIQESRAIIQYYSNYIHWIQQGFWRAGKCFSFAESGLSHRCTSGESPSPSSLLISKSKYLFPVERQSAFQVEFNFNKNSTRDIRFAFTYLWRMTWDTTYLNCI